MPSVRRTQATAHGIRPVGGPLLGRRRRAALAAVSFLLAACEIPQSPDPPPPVAAAGPVAEAPDPFAPEAVEQQAQLGLSVLHARGAAELLSRSCALRGPLEPVGFGQRLVLVMEIRNPFPEPVELLLPEEGFGLEFRYQVRRLFPDGGEELTSQVRVARLDEEVVLGPGGTYRKELDFELDPGDSLSALWELELGLSLRLAGLQVGERELPLAEFALRPARFVAFPPGWEALAADPLGGLAQAAALDSPQADRHLLVCAELLPEVQREQGIATLAAALPEAPNPRRAVTIAAALGRLTGLDFGPAPQRWIEWWRTRQNERP